MLRTATSRGLALRRLTCSSRASTNRSDLVVAPSAHGLTAETVVVALEGTKTIKHSKRLSSRITRLELRWSASWCSGLHRCCGACVVLSTLRPMSFDPGRDLERPPL